MHWNRAKRRSEECLGSASTRWTRSPIQSNARPFAARAVGRVPSRQVAAKWMSAEAGGLSSRLPRAAVVFANVRATCKRPEEPHRVPSPSTANSRRRGLPWLPQILRFDFGTPPLGHIDSNCDPRGIQAASSARPADATPRRGSAAAHGASSFPQLRRTLCGSTAHIYPRAFLAP